MPTFTLEDDLALARVAIAQADLVSLARFRAQDLVITTKPDRTPVTDADKAVEAIIRRTPCRCGQRTSIGHAMVGGEGARRLDDNRRGPKENPARGERG